MPTVTTDAYVKGVHPQEFVERMLSRGVTLILDVRRSFYRSPPYYPSAFEKLVRPHMRYVYEKEFGNPYKISEYPNWRENKRLYQNYVLTEKKQLLERWKRFLKENPREVVAVVCWCPTNDPMRCHRFWLEELLHNPDEIGEKKTAEEKLREWLEKIEKGKVYEPFPAKKRVEVPPREIDWERRDRERRRRVEEEMAKEKFLREMADEEIEAEIQALSKTLDWRLTRLEEIEAQLKKLEKWRQEKFTSLPREGYERWKRKFYKPTLRKLHEQGDLHRIEIAHAERTISKLDHIRRLR